MLADLLSPRRWPLRAKLLVGVVLASVVPLAVLATLNVSALRHHLVGASTAELDRLAATEGMYLAGVLSEQLVLMETLALEATLTTTLVEANRGQDQRDPVAALEWKTERDRSWATLPPDDPWLLSLLDPARNPATAQLRHFQQHFPDHVELFLTDRSGSVVGSTGRTSDFDQADEEWWQRAYAGGRGDAFVARPAYDASSKVTAVDMAVPIRSVNPAKVLGVLRTTYRVGAIEQLLARARFGDTGHVTLFDDTHHVVASTDGTEVGSSAPPSWSAPLTAGAGSFWGVLRSRTDEPLVASLAPVAIAGDPRTERAAAVRRLGWVVVVHQHEGEALDPAVATARRGLAVGIFFAAVALLFALAAARYALAPIQHLARIARRMETGDLSVRMVVEHQDELGELSRAFNAMADEVAATVESLEERVELRTAELQAARIAAEAATKAKSAFLASMSHELRTPLNSIIGFSELLCDQAFGPLNEKQAKYTNNVLTSGRHLLELVNDILDISKVEAGKMSLDLEPVRIDALFDASLVMLRPRAATQGVELTARATEAARALTFAVDPRKFKQILFNLLANAVKFTPRGGSVSVSAEILSTTALGDEATRLGLDETQRQGNAQWLRVAVRDTGIGIAPADQERIFREFEQVGGRVGEGTGLGLALCRKLVELHGGVIWVDSEGADRGSTFAFLIPAKAPEAAVLGTIAAEASPAAEPTETTPALSPEPSGTTDDQAPLILVVDDDVRANELVGVYLKGAGFRVASAFDGLSAVELANRLQPALITLDISLPRKDGWEVLVELKASPALREVPVIIVSVVDKRPFGLKLGAEGYFVKPVQKQELLEAVRRALARPTPPSATVLVADDDQPTVDLLTAQLEDAGYSVISTLGGRACLEAAKAQHPDLVILDLVMPEVSGFDVIRELRSSPATRNLPILVFTGKRLTAQERARLSADVREIMAKDPDSREDLLAAVARHLDRQGAHNQSPGEA